MPTSALLFLDRIPLIILERVPGSTISAMSVLFPRRAIGITVTP
jgi:hypothetical protein